MFSRQDEIPKAHQRTCHWIFSSLNRRGPGEIHHKAYRYNCGDANKADDTSARVTSTTNSETSASDNQNSDDHIQSQVWSSFVDWLEHDDEIYWLNEKPGSGKFTLMKYMTSEFQTKCSTIESLDKRFGLCDLVVTSFFF